MEPLEQKMPAFEMQRNTSKTEPDCMERKTHGLQCRMLASAPTDL